MKRLLIAVVVLLVPTLRLAAQDISLAKILVENEDWREVAKGWPGVTFLDAEPAGSIGIYQGQLSGRVGVNGKAEKVETPDILIERSQTSVVRPVARYTIDAEGKSIIHAPVGGKEQTLKLDGLAAPACLTLWPDEGHLVIGESSGRWLWAVRIEGDGSFGPGDRYYSLRTTRPGEKMRVMALAMDAAGLLYACTPLGVQVFDPTGRLSGVIAAPAQEGMTAITIGGDKGETLFVACGDRIYARRIQGKALYTLLKKK